MPQITTLRLSHFRNFAEAQFEFSPGINAIIGPNGSGKTSILEAIYFLAYGKSFRVKELNRMVEEGQKTFTLFAEGLSDNASKFQVGMQRGGVESINRMNGETIKTLSPFAETLPLILLEPLSFQLLTGGSRHRRQLMDWGVFYHEAQSHLHYAMVRKAIKQRNQALKQRASRQHIRLWETTCLKSCEVLSEYRARYLIALTKILTRLLGKIFMNQHALSMGYDQGWPEDKTLPEAWEESFSQDLRWGYTSQGPHQADLKVFSHKKPAKDILSRGQQKLFVSMLKLAQGLLLTEKKQIFPIYLFDDLASELDLPHCKKIAKALAGSSSQIFLTSIHPPKDLFEEAHLMKLI